MKCIVTGGAGFIGSFLCEHLLADGHMVLAIDNLLTGNKKNISHLISNPQFTFLQGDCSQRLNIQGQFDLILHFASPASPPKYQKYPVETLLVNSIGTYYLVELAREWGARFIFASTSEIYGDPLKHPQKEDYWGNVNPNGERSCYDESKRLGETIVSTYVRKFKLDGWIMRIFNTYGPRMDIDDGRVVTNFIKQILTQSPLTINGKGDQTRSFCFVSDLVRGILQVAYAPSCSGEIFNIGNPQEMTVLELAEQLIQMTGYTGTIEFKQLPQDDPMRRKPDISKIQKAFNWTPQVSLEDGLVQTIEYLKNAKNV